MFRNPLFMKLTFSLHRRGEVILSAMVGQVMVVQSLVECARVLQVMDCTFNEHSWTVYFADGVVLASFMVAIWGIMVLCRAEFHKLRAHRVALKFIVFKVMIAVSKFLQRLLTIVIEPSATKGILSPKEKTLGENVN